MKKIYLLFLLLVAMGLSKGYSQLIHSKGDMGVVLGVNYVLNGYNVSAGYNYLVSNDFMLKGLLLYEAKKMEFSKLNVMALEVDGLYTFYRIGNNIFFNMGLGIYSGFEMSKHDVFDPYRKFVVGEAVLLSADYYVNPKIVISLGVKQRVVHLSELGMFSWYSGIGFGYNL